LGVDKDEDAAAVSADEITTMAAEIVRGVCRSESAVTMTPAHRQVWDDLADQARG